MVLAFLALMLHAGASAGTAPPPREIAAAQAPRMRVLVRIDPRAAGNGFRIRDVVDQVREIWQPYIDLDFAGEGTGSAPATGAASPRATGDSRQGPPAYDDELTLLIIDRLQPPDDRLQGQESSGSSDESALGWIRFVAGRPESTITVSVAAARSLMSRGSWLGRRVDELPLPFQRRFVTNALSRSAAHEIGHYLLRSNAHAPDGLMRQRMTVPEIMEERLTFFRLRTSEVGVLERRAPRALASTPLVSAELLERGRELSGDLAGVPVLNLTAPEHVDELAVLE
jgi:predicted RNA-binding protein YlxR (DUF448 family)